MTCPPGINAFFLFANLRYVIKYDIITPTKQAT